MWFWIFIGLIFHTMRGLPVVTLSCRSTVSRLMSTHSDTDYPWSTQDMHASSRNKIEIWICHSNKKYTYESVNILNICRLLVLCLKNSYSKLISRTLQKLVSHLIFTFSILKAKHYNALCFHQANFQSQFSFAPKSERALR